MYFALHTMISFRIFAVAFSVTTAFHAVLAHPTIKRATPDAAGGLGLTDIIAVQDLRFTYEELTVRPSCDRARGAANGDFVQFKLEDLLPFASKDAKVRESPTDYVELSRKWNSRDLAGVTNRIWDWADRNGRTSPSLSRTSRRPSWPTSRLYSSPTRFQTWTGTAPS